MLTFPLAWLGTFYCSRIPTVCWRVGDMHKVGWGESMGIVGPSKSHSGGNGAFQKNICHRNGLWFFVCLYDWAHDLSVLTFKTSLKSIVNLLWTLLKRFLRLSSTLNVKMLLIRRSNWDRVTDNYLLKAAFESWKPHQIKSNFEDESFSLIYLVPTCKAILICNCCVPFRRILHGPHCK